MQSDFQDNGDTQSELISPKMYVYSEIRYVFSSPLNSLLCLFGRVLYCFSFKFTPSCMFCYFMNIILLSPYFLMGVLCFKALDRLKVTHLCSLPFLDSIPVILVWEYTCLTHLTLHQYISQITAAKQEFICTCSIFCQNFYHLYHHSHQSFMSMDISK